MFPQMLLSQAVLPPLVKAKITIINKGSAHPYHLVTEGWSRTHVWGWVDEGSFS